MPQHVAFRPAAFTLIEGGKGRKMKDLVPAGWAAAIVGPYSYGDGTPCNLLVVDGRIVHGPRLDYPWPVLIVHGGEAKIVRHQDAAEILTSGQKIPTYAFAAGPMLIERGVATHYRRLIHEQRFEGLVPDSRVRRTGIGLKRDKVVAVYHESATLQEFQATGLALALDHFMNTDGGSAAGWYSPTGKRIEPTRSLPAVIVATDVLGEVLPVPRPKAIVALDPGHGGRDRFNRGPGGWCEADGALFMALVARDYLEEAGCKVILTRDADIDLAPDDRAWDQGVELTARCYAANAAQADVFVSIHTNAGSPGARGTETYHSVSPTSMGKELAAAVHRAVVGALGTADRGLKARAGTDGRDFYAVIRQTRMPAIICEVAFHSDPSDEARLKRAQTLVSAGEAIAAGVLSYLDKVGLLTA